MDNEEKEESKMEETFKLSSGLGKSDKTSHKEESQILDPDNPLLERFQKALKEHLERQIQHLKNDICDCESGIKNNNAKREQLGVMAYEQQQVLDKQQKTLDQYISKLQSTAAAREELENVVAEKKEIFKTKRDLLFKQESEEKVLKNEIESTNLLIRQISEWENNLESDITVKKRIYEKTRKDKQKLLEEKRFQDALIYRLMTRIWHLEQELEKMDTQMKIKEEEREELAQTVALGNTNIEAMESEYRCLMHSWNSVVIAIGNRDKVLSCLTQEYTKSDEQFKSILAEMEQVKKLSQKEMRKNEEWTMLKQRFLGDVQNCKQTLDEEFAKKEVLEKKMFEMKGIIEQTDADLRKIEDETQDADFVYSGLLRDHGSLNAYKSELEECLLRFLEEQVTNSKTAATLRSALKHLRATNREMEIQCASLENKIANVVSEIEVQKLANFESQRYLNELEDQLTDLGKEADGYQDEMKKLDLVIAKRQREVDFLNNRYLKLVEKCGSSHSSPLELKITALEKNIEEMQAQNKQLQMFWLREQGNLLKISAERQEQIQNNNLMRKQILILEQKNLKVTDELEAHKKQKDKVVRAINNLHSQLTVMGDNFVKTKGLKINMDKDNEVMRQDYVYKLKDAELECLQLQDEIEQLEEEKVNMSKELLEMNRQALEWEKKLLSAKETKTAMLQERSDEGEVGTMKAEIHRMNVRLSQLKKVQDVLVNDLEHCVSRRDSIVTTAEAREKRTKGGMEKTRINFNRKLDDVRNKMKQMENQIDEMKKKMEEYEEEKKRVEEEIDAMNRDIERCNSNQVDMIEQTEETKTQRQMNFEMLLQIQKKLNTYDDLSKGRSPHMVYRTESSSSIAFNKESTTNSKLIKVIENLQTDFPNHIHELNRLSNTLKLPAYVYYQ